VVVDASLIRIHINIVSDVDGLTTLRDFTVGLNVTTAAIATALATSSRFSFFHRLDIKSLVL
jgi:hypothetical protein